jgi:glutathione S-transferase
MLALYHHGTSVCAAKPRLVLAEKGIEWESRYIDILANEQFAPEYLALNPEGVVPTLDHDGQVIRESTLICEYLNTVFPETPLVPDDAFGRYEMRRWTMRMDKDHPMNVGPLTFAISHRHRILELGEEAVENYINSMGPEQVERRQRQLSSDIEAPLPKAGLKMCDKLLSDMEATLGERPWLAGKEFSLADIGVIPYINRLDMLQLSGMWTEGRPQVTDWFGRVKDRASFMPAMFEFVPPPLAAWMREKGAEAWPKVKSVLEDS